MRNAFLFLCAAAVALTALGFTGCANSGGPKPPHREYSSMPQNMPAQWEGQSRMGGMPMQY
ncbi:MAG: hypothetical protein KDM91_04855 [Verrucomicrobiae bacterium]|nr:hypothetical protein [Verrucomicrobiae bacterium]MCP5538696.1 hypothetical protein [Akkermansiaceae bacterium]MCP5550585.1 hypothetical protein [Akkermansiaceae bacterium]